jgi:hypothetical protein
VWTEACVYDGVQMPVFVDIIMDLRGLQKEGNLLSVCGAVRLDELLIRDEIDYLIGQLYL